MTMRTFRIGRALAAAGVLGLLAASPALAQQPVEATPPGVVDRQLAADDATFKYLRAVVENPNEAQRYAGIAQALNQSMDSLYTVLRDPADPALGATLEQAPEALRAQLDLPKGQGLVVSSLAGDGPAAQAGLKDKDILLRLEGKPLDQPADLTARLKEVGERDATLELLREGKPEKLVVRPRYRVSLGAPEKQKVSFFVGVGVNPVDDTVRAHLSLPAGEGLVVNQVAGGSPAEKAGIKTHDILLSFGDTALRTNEDLVSAVQNAGEAATTVRLLRAGKTDKIQVTPVKKTEKAETTQEESLRLLRLGHQAHPEMYPYQLFRQPIRGRTWSAQETPGTAPSDPRIDALEKEIKSLRGAVEELTRSLKSPRTATPVGPRD